MKNKQVCYTSSYDRGLEHLLKIWGDVKKAVPEATLHVAYGWQLFESFYRNNPGMMAWKEKMDKLLTQDGVVHHGRLSQPEIEKLMRDSGIWAYPTHFGEISCISAMKAQAFGAIPVVINYAALETTVQYGNKIEGDIFIPEVKEKFKDALIKALKDDAWQEKVRPEMMEFASKNFSWTKVAEQWNREFGGDDLKEAMDVILKHDPSLEKYMPVQLQQKYGLKETL